MKVKSIGRPRRVFSALAVLGVVSLAAPRAQEVDEKPKVTLTISVPGNTFEQGRQIPVRLEFANWGREDFIVGRHLDIGSFTSPSYITVSLRDASTGTEAKQDDISEWLAPLTLARWWVAIPPNHFYGTEIKLIGAILPGKPGHYLVQIKYTSKGGLTSPVLEKGVPAYPVWRGTLESNTIPIEILPSR